MGRSELQWDLETLDNIVEHHWIELAREICMTRLLEYLTAFIFKNTGWGLEARQPVGNFMLPNVKQ